MDYSEAVRRVEEYYRTPMDWVSRKSQPMQQRAVLIHILLDDGYHVTQIADFLGVNRTTVIHHRKSMYYPEFVKRRKEVMTSDSVENTLKDYQDKAKYQIVKPYLSNLTIEEVKELSKTIELHLKAKQWKTKDKVKVYNCSTDISSLVF